MLLKITKYISTTENNIILYDGFDYNIKRLLELEKKAPRRKDEIQKLIKAITIKVKNNIS